MSAIALVACARCRRKHSATAAACPFCGARPSDPVAVPDAPPAASCPVCGDAPGSSTVCLETREFKDASVVRGIRRYLVRSVEVPGVCTSCSSTIERRRYVADVLCIVPIVVAFIATVVADSKFPFGLLLLYLVYLARRLHYNWADALVYGDRLSDELAKWKPVGDAGTLAVPVPWLHRLVRIGVIPAGVTALALVAGSGLIRPRHHRSAESESAPAPGVDNLAELTSLLRAATAMAVPLTSETGDLVSALRVVPFGAGGRRLMQLPVYADAALLPLQTLYQPMTGGQLLGAFRRSEADLLIVESAKRRLILLRSELGKLAATVPIEDPPALVAQRSP